VTAISHARPTVTRLWLAAAGRAAVAMGAAIRVSRRPARMVPGMAGAGLVAYGAALVYPPAGFIVGGLFLLWFGSEINRLPKPQEPPEYH
jgi:hypothetical protein